MRSGAIIDMEAAAAAAAAACANAPRTRLPGEAPHCVTCFCLSSGKAKCRQPACCARCKETEENCHHRSSKHSLEGSGRRHISVRKSARKCSTTVDELLRELNIANGGFSDDVADEFRSRELRDRPSNEEVGNEGSSPRQRRHRRGSGYRATPTERQQSGREEARRRSCERWSPAGRGPAGRRNRQLQMVPAEEQSSDVSADAKAAPSEAEPEYSGPRDAWSVGQAARLFGTGDLDDRPPPSRDADKDSCSEAEESAWSAQELGNSEAHVRELKLVRREVIERLYGEARKLRRLQRHLDACSPRRAVPATHSVCTMTAGDLPNGDT